MDLEADFKLLIGVGYWCWLLVLVIGVGYWCWLLVLVIGVGYWCWLLVLVMRFCGVRLRWVLPVSHSSEVSITMAVTRRRSDFSLGKRPVMRVRRLIWRLRLSHILDVRDSFFTVLRKANIFCPVPQGGCSNIREMVLSG
jgi:hypothetical protein